MADVYEAMVQAREEALAEIHDRELETIKSEVKEDTTSKLAVAISALDKIRALQDRYKKYFADLK